METTESRSAESSTVDANRDADASRVQPQTLPPRVGRRRDLRAVAAEAQARFPKIMARLAE